MSSYATVQTAHLRLSRTTAADVDVLHAIATDPRVWTHYPSLRPTERAQTRETVAGWQGSWAAHGLGMWTVRVAADGRVIGYGGCMVSRAGVWNLGYRLSPDAHGHGYATELALRAVDAARDVEPERPVTAFLVEHNRASARVAEKVGLRLVHRAPDAGNPDPSVQRLVYADRDLDAEVLAAVLR